MKTYGLKKGELRLRMKQLEFKSKTIYLRLAEPSDAAFIHALRIDKQYNQYLSSVDDDVSKQEKWLIDYKRRENLGQEFYYIIHLNSSSIPIGTVRVYDFLGERDSFSWGSWILNEKKTKYAALECVLLIYDFAFLEMGFKRCHMDMRKQNLKIIDFHKRLGAKIIGETNEDFLAHYFPEDYLKIRNDIKKIIENKNSK